MKPNAKRSDPGRSRRTPAKSFEAEKSLRLFCDATGQELATVLAAIVGELDHALANSQPAARERSVMTAVVAAERALSLARNLRYFSVHSRLNVQTMDLSQVMLDTVELVEKELELANVKIAVLAEASTYVQGDAGALQQVILNLLAFARQALPKGGQITLSLRQVEDQIEIRCADTGHGIPEREMETVFDITGGIAAHRLGLAVSRALVEAHGGSMEIQSRVGVGTTVTLHLPFDPATKKPQSFNEERRFRRINLNLPVELFLSRGQTTIKTELSTLSIGGCFTLLTDLAGQPLPELNDTVSLRIHYFGDECLEIQRGRVASVSWAGNQSGVGIEFVELDARAKKILTAIVKSHST